VRAEADKGAGVRGGVSDAAIDVLFVVTPQVLLLDLAGPAEAFRIANQRLVRDGKSPRFVLRFGGAAPTQRSSVGVTLAGLEALPDTLPNPIWVVLLGQPSEQRRRTDPATQACADWLRRSVAPLLAQPQHRLVTVCAGTLLAARAGLVGTRRCTTHHELLDELRRLAPAAQVVDNRVFVVDGSLASSAGITAGIDLALHLIGRECGEAVAASVASNMVVYLRRSAQDPELSPLLAHRQHLHPALHRVQEAVCADPARDWAVPAMAAVGHVTERHLARLFAAHAGISPLAWLRSIRLERARLALAHGASVTRAAEQAGFSSDLQLRRAWSGRLVGTPRDAAVPADRGDH